MLKNIFIIIVLILSAHTLKAQVWQALPNSPEVSSRFDDMYCINKDTLITVDGGGNVNKSTNGGASWFLASNIPNNTYLRCVGFFDANTGVLGTLQASKPIFRTTNGGSNWTQITSFQGGAPRGGCGVAIASSTTAYMTSIYHGPQAVMKTTDRGLTWKNVSPDTSLASTLIDCYFWSADSGLIVGGYNRNGAFTGKSVVLMTTNGGTSWSTKYISTRNNEWCWKIHFINRLIGYVSIERYTSPTFYLKTTDGGMTWSEKSYPVNNDVEGICFINENTGWIGGWGNDQNGQTYETTNGGTSWHQVSWGRNLNRFRIINDTLGYAVGEKVYKYSMPLLNVKNISSEIPSEYKLNQNYPNPFNPSTKIKFEIPQSGLVTLEVYDVLGKRVSELISEQLNAGTYEKEWNASDLNSGVYYARFTSGGITLTTKMLLVK